MPRQACLLCIETVSRRRPAGTKMAKATGQALDMQVKLALFWHGHFAVNESKVRD